MPLPPDASAPASAPNESAVFTPARLGPVELRNRVIKCGTNEGMAREGRVTDHLIEWHRAFAAGGVAMSTLAYCSVSSEGRTFGDQIWMRDEAMPGLRRFSDAMHAESARACIQLGHAGWFAHPRAMGKRPLGPSRMFSPHAMTFSRGMQESDFARITVEFAEAARRAVDAGFDAIEVHMGHGYLLSQFLSPYNNRRRDRWGGTLENRARFPRAVVAAIREAVGSGIAVFPKLNMDDGFRGGLTLEDGLRAARLFEEDGHVDAFQLTGGHTTRSPMYLLRGDVPLREMIRYESDWVRRFGLRTMGKFLVKGFAFEEAFFLPMARRFREASKLPIILLGGLNRLDSMNAALGEGFGFIALGRALISDPDLVNRMRAGEVAGSSCNHCNQCIAEMEREGGVRCVLRER